MLTSNFPTRGTSAVNVWFELWPYYKKQFRREKKLELGSLDTPPLFIAQTIASLFSRRNINHLGNWSGPKDSPWLTQKLERSLIGQISNLFKTDLKEVGGYIASGGSESNLFLTWLGREWLKKKGVTSIRMLMSDLTHYSIGKAARITGMEILTVPLDRTSWGMNEIGLSRVVQTAYQAGIKGFCLPLTLGYPATGTADDIDKIISTIKLLLKKYPGTRFFIWIDAAMDGLIEPFINHNFSPFGDKLIQGMLVDFHKFGGVQPCASVVLYRQPLINLIKKKISYLSINDATLLGGRNGIPAISSWAVVKQLGRKGFEKRAKYCLKQKMNLIKGLNKLKVPFITRENSLTLGILLNQKQRLPVNIESKYSLYLSRLKLRYQDTQKEELVRLYKIHILPHITSETIDDFLVDLSNYLIS